MCEISFRQQQSYKIWYLEIHNRKMTSTEAMLQNNVNWEHVSLQKHSRHQVYRLHKPLLSVVFILTTMFLASFTVMKQKVTVSAELILLGSTGQSSPSMRRAASPVALWPWSTQTWFAGSHGP